MNASGQTLQQQSPISAESSATPIAGHSPRGHLVAYCAIGIMAVGAFGPYTSLRGVRTEQIVVYGLLSAGIFILAGLPRLHVTRQGAIIAALLTTEALLALLGVLAPAGGLVDYPAGSLLGGIDNLLLPIGVLLIVHALVSFGADISRLLRITCIVLVTAMCINAAIAYGSLYLDTKPLLSIFWENDPTAQSVAEGATQLGRFTGIFNQPGEAGVLYGLSLLAAIYLCRHSMVKLIIFTTILTIGGVLSVSKIFLLVGLPVGAWQAMQVSGTRGRTMVMLLGWGTAATIAFIFPGPQWTGAGFLSRLWHPGDSRAGLIDLYTAGRLGDSFTLEFVSDAVLGASPWFGLGARGLAAPYDNGWVEALVVAGIVGLVIYTAVLLSLAITWLRRRRRADPAQSRFAAGLVLILIGASVGLPVLTANRVATVVWILVSLLLLSPIAAQALVQDPVLAPTQGPAKKPSPVEGHS